MMKADRKRCGLRRRTMIMPVRFVRTKFGGLKVCVAASEVQLTHRIIFAAVSPLFQELLIL